MDRLQWYSSAIESSSAMRERGKVAPCVRPYALRPEAVGGEKVSDFGARSQSEPGEALASSSSVQSLWFSSSDVT